MKAERCVGCGCYEVLTNVTARSCPQQSANRIQAPPRAPAAPLRRSRDTGGPAKAKDVKAKLHRFEEDRDENWNLIIQLKIDSNKNSAPTFLGKIRIKSKCLYEPCLSNSWLALMTWRCTKESMQMSASGDSHCTRGGTSKATPCHHKCCDGCHMIGKLSYDHAKC